MSKKYRVVKRGLNQWQVRSNDRTPSYSKDTEGTLVCICFNAGYADQVFKALEANPLPDVWSPRGSKAAQSR